MVLTVVTRTLIDIAWQQEENISQEGLRKRDTKGAPPSRAVSNVSQASHYSTVSLSQASAEKIAWEFNASVRLVWKRWLWCAPLLHVLDSGHPLRLSSTKAS